MKSRVFSPMESSSLPLAPCGSTPPHSTLAFPDDVSGPRRPSVFRNHAVEDDFPLLRPVDHVVRGGACRGSSQAKDAQGEEADRGRDERNGVAAACGEAGHEQDEKGGQADPRPRTRDGGGVSRHDPGDEETSRRKRSRDHMSYLAERGVPACDRPGLAMGELFGGKTLDRRSTRPDRKRRSACRIQEGQTTNRACCQRGRDRNG